MSGSVLDDQTPYIHNLYSNKWAYVQVAYFLLMSGSCFWVGFSLNSQEPNITVILWFSFTGLFVLVASFFHLAKATADPERLTARYVLRPAIKVPWGKVKKVRVQGLRKPGCVVIFGDSIFERVHIPLKREKNRLNEHSRHVIATIVSATDLELEKEYAFEYADYVRK